MELLDFLIRNQSNLWFVPATIWVMLGVGRLVAGVRGPGIFFPQHRPIVYPWQRPKDDSRKYHSHELEGVRLAVTFRSIFASYEPYVHHSSLGLLLWSLFLGFSPVPQAVALPLPPPARELQNNKNLLVFMHGWDGDPLDTWKSFPQLVLADTTFDSFNVSVVSYPTYYARRNLGIRPMARWLNDRFDRDGIYARYENIWIVGHSMGGLIARELLIANRLQRDNKKFRLLVEIASPHQGASIALLANALGVSRGFVEDLTPRSQFLLTLREDWNALKDRPKTFCLTSPHDQIVSIDSAIAQCDEYLQYPQWGHIEMVKPLDPRDERYRVPMSRVKGI